MSTPAIDYDALAAQHGGTATIDYDALAAQHGGTVSNSLPPGVRVVGKNAAGQDIYGPEEQPSNASLYGQALFNPVGSGAHDQGIVGGLEQIGGRAMQAITNPVMHLIDTPAGIYNSLRHPIDTASQRIQEFGQDWQKSPALALENATGDVLGVVEGGRIGGAAAAKAADLAGSAASRGLLLGKTPAEAYESALKPSTTLSQAERSEAVNTALANSIPVSKNGLTKISGLIDNLNQKISNEIAADPNRPIDPQAVAARANQVIPRFANQVNANGDLTAIEASKQQFLAEQGAKPGTPAGPPQPTGLLDAQGRPIMNAGTPAQPPQPAPPMGAANAQLMKQGTYRVLAGKFGEQGSATVEAQKALARGLKEEIANQFPEINDLNAQESKLLDLQPILERAINRTANHQLIGIGTPVAGAAVKAVTGSGSLGAVAGVLKAVLDNPMVKSRLAIAISKGGGIPYAQAAGRVAVYATALGSSAQSPQATQGGPTPTQ